MSCVEFVIDNGKWNVNQSSKLEAETFAIYSDVDGRRDIDRIISEIDFNYHQNIIFFGLKAAKIAIEIAKKKSLRSNLMIVELMDKNRFTIDIDMNELNNLIKTPGVELIIDKPENISTRIYNTYLSKRYYDNARNFNVITMPYIKSTYSIQIQGIFRSVFENAHTIIKSYGNSVEDILVGYDNVINNWGHYLSGVHATQFKNKFSNKPCILVGAGPSLDKNIDLLKDAANHALIIVVDAAYKRVVQHGIKPDVVATIERTEKSCTFYEHIEYEEEVVLLAPSVIQKSIFDKFKHVVFTGREQDMFLSEITRLMGNENLDIGSNAIHLPFAFATYLDCDPIVYVGLDLAYTGGKTHTGTVGASHDIATLYAKDENVTVVKGQNGEMLETLVFFMYAKKLLEVFMYEDSKRKYINATEGGALIEYTSNQTLSQVIEEISDIQIKDNEFLNLYRAISKDISADENKDKVRTKRLLEYIQEFENDFMSLRDLVLSEHNKLEKTDEGILTMIDNNIRNVNIYQSEHKQCHFLVQSLYISFVNSIYQLPAEPSDVEVKMMKEMTLSYLRKLYDVAGVIKQNLSMYYYAIDNNFMKEL